MAATGTRHHSVKTGLSGHTAGGRQKAQANKLKLKREQEEKNRLLEIEKQSKLKLVLRRAAEEKEKLEAQEQKLVEKRVKARHAMLLEKAMRDLKEYHAKLLNEELEKIKLENEEKARVKALKKTELAILKKTKTMLQLKKAKEKNKLFARKQSIQQGNDDNNDNNNNNIIGYFAAISGGLNTYNLCINVIFPSSSIHFVINTFSGLIVFFKFRDLLETSS